MQIAKWGNSLAVRLPADLVRKLDLREGDQVELVPGDAGLAVTRQPRAEDVLQGLRRFRGRLAPEDRLSRDTAHER
ncbi:MazF family transcriptional regulator [Salipiger aestuarii]|uniref:Antitoxin MazE n=1 Tax=Salipiger aestuarii TaxID=568098 RepID=A0A327YFA3_9RHOB|nr:AbrB/MazE/SpoVT family DNA-binding domain-containing protein [Salipiger aestuarii]EIE51436.1 transcriptional regulator/antitoxin, MazE [Citreicella sp. 357]KAA8608941.1 MazF family transcriptional regulator [Salipiger aestuarii]KAA8613143.1 MazF family transcriptional regulator [Salipiger aestuarii]KAB2543002.1 MazF family transcriptional regulator [Salipiger aestuarii]RAK19738.1 antitoxin MazE [Salipiger aestuarii]